MAKEIVAGSTGVILELFFTDLADGSEGAGKTGIVAGDLSGEYSIGNAADVALSFAAGSVGDAYSSGKFAEKGNGRYLWHTPNAMWATVDTETVATIRCANAAPVVIRRSVIAANKYSNTTHMDGQAVSATGAIDADRINNADVLTSSRNATEPPSAASVAAAVELAILDEGDATALLGAIAAKVEEFVNNDGDASATLQAIATAVWTHATRTLSAGVDATSIGGTAITAQIRDAFLYFFDQAAPAKRVNDVGTASGSGSNHTPEDVAALILANPLNKLATDATGAVTVSNGAGIAGDVWAHATRTLSAFGFNVSIGAGGINAAAFANDAIGAAALSSAAVAKIEQALMNEGDGQALIDAIVQAIDAADIDAGLIPSLVRDAILNRVLAGNHDTAGTVGKLLQDIEGNTGTDIPNAIAGVQSAVGNLNDVDPTAIESACSAALVSIHLDHLLAADYDPANKPGAATALLNELVGNDAGVSQFTANTLELAPTGGGGGATAAEVAAEVRDLILAGDKTPITMAAGKVDANATAVVDESAIAAAVVDALPGGTFQINRFGPDYDPVSQTIKLTRAKDYPNAKGLSVRFDLPTITGVDWTANDIELVWTGSAAGKQPLTATATIDNSGATPAAVIEWARDQIGSTAGEYKWDLDLHIPNGAETDVILIYQGRLKLGETSAAILPAGDGG